MNLIEDPWVPVETHAGTRIEVSTRDALTHAHEYRALSIDTAIVAVALLRHLLAVTIDAVGAPESVDEYERRWDGGRFGEAELGAYLDSVGDRFELFDETAPFAQVGGLATSKGETKPISLLMPHISTGNNVPLFGVRTDAEPPALRVEEAVRWLLTAHCYDTAGIKSGAAGDSQAKNGKVTANLAPLGQFGAVVPIGRNLFETLMLNTVIVPDGRSELGVPAWRQDPQSAEWSTRSVGGILDQLTFGARRVRLIGDDSDVSGHTTVSRVVLAAGDRPAAIPEFEPHAMWRTVKNPKPGDPAMRPIRHRSDQAAWQGLGALLAVRRSEDDAGELSTPCLRQIGELVQEMVLPPDYPLAVLCAGVEYGNMQAVVENTIADTIPLPVVALQSDAAIRSFLLDVAESAEQIARALNDVDRDLRAIHSGEAVPWDKGQRLGTRFIHQVDPVVRRVLAGVRREPDRLTEASEAWRSSAESIARAIANDRLSAAPLSAHAGKVTADNAGRPKDVRLETVRRNFSGWLRRALTPFGTPEPASNPETQAVIS